MYGNHDDNNNSNDNGVGSYSKTTKCIRFHERLYRRVFRTYLSTISFINDTLQQCHAIKVSCCRSRNRAGRVTSTIDLERFNNIYFFFPWRLFAPRCLKHNRFMIVEDYLAAVKHDRWNTAIENALKNNTLDLFSISVYILTLKRASSGYIKTLSRINSGLNNGVQQLIVEQY